MLPIAAYACGARTTRAHLAERWIMYGYEHLVDVIALRNLQMQAEHWLLTQVLVWSTLI